MDVVTQELTEIDMDFPSLWGVKFLNDDYTPMDFVVLVLVHHFALDPEEAVSVMEKVHTDGEAVVGAYTKDIAMTKAALSESAARQSGHPLRLEAVAV